MNRILARALPWTRHLPENSLDDMAAELVQALRSPCAPATSFSQTLAEWRHTAEVYADPVLLAELTRDRDGDVGPVPRPAEGTVDDEESHGPEPAQGQSGTLGPPVRP